MKKKILFKKLIKVKNNCKQIINKMIHKLWKLNNNKNVKLIKSNNQQKMNFNRINNK